MCNESTNKCDHAFVRGLPFTHGIGKWVLRMQLLPVKHLVMFVKKIRHSMVLDVFGIFYYYYFFTRISKIHEDVLGALSLT